MTLDEFIKYEEEIANGYEKNAKHIREKMKSDIALSNADDLDKYAKKHRQLAEWLKELKQLREQEPFINKPCVSGGVCKHDKNKVLDKIRTEIEQTSETIDGFLIHDGTKRTVLQIIDKYKAESEVEDEKNKIGLS